MLALNEEGQSVTARPVLVLVTSPPESRTSKAAAEVTNALKGDPPALYFIGYPGDGTTIVRTWVQQGGPQRFLLNDGMNAADFIKGVGPQFLNNAFGTSSGTTKTASTEFFAQAYPAMSGGFDAGAGELPPSDRLWLAALARGLRDARGG